jgi:hypothetical protein
MGGMNILLSGPVEGFISSLLKQSKARDAHWSICSGDFGIYPDQFKMDRAARQYGGNEFASRYVGADLSPINIPILTVSGCHDDNKWLAERKAANNTEILSNCHWLAGGYRTTIGFNGPPCRITGLGRAYSQATYEGRYTKRSHRHYTRHDVERACSSGPTDLLVVYENLDAPGIRNVIFATRPKLILVTKHLNRKIYPEIQGIPVVTLDRQERQLVVWGDNSFIY